MTDFKRALVRAFANAFARKIVALVVLGIAAAVGYSSKAHAQDQEPCTTTTPCTRGQAYSYASAYGNSYVCPPGNYPVKVSSRVEDYISNTRMGPVVVCRSSDGVHVVENFLNPRWFYSGCPANTVWNASTGICEKNCTAEADFISTPTYAMRNGTVACTDGCETAYFANGDGTYTGKPSVMGRACSVLPECSTLGGGYYLNTSSGHCEPPPNECASNQTKGPGGTCVDACPSGMHQAEDGTCEQDDDNCPAGEIRAPSGACLPGEGQCAAGEAKKKDGTCGRDSDGDGEADDDDEDPENDTDKEQFSGGDNCDNPPSCSGSLILCGQARIQWRIDCNTRKDIKISGGSCDAIPLCTGKNCNAMEYSQLLMQWRTSCKAVGEGGGGEGGQPDWTKVGGMSQDGGAGQTAEDVKGVELVEFDTDDLDQSGFGGAASCPALYSGSATGMGSEFVQQLASPPAIFCTWVGAVKVIMILFGTIIAAFITVRMH